MTARMRVLALVTAVCVVFVAGCSSDGAPGAAGSSSSPPGPFVLRLGASPDTAQAPALVAIANGSTASALGSTPVQPASYAVSSDPLDEIAAGVLDAAFVDPVSALSIVERAKGRT